ncbi:MAG: hypothetical protein COA32_14795 [Fluviicola sp.]|nr:MAG: hypothetical protein COA32_14795 [Fluviicola sp.]
MIWEKADEEDNRVKKSSEWISLESYKDELEERSGVYIFANDDLDVKYVGKAGAGRMVVENKDKQQEEEVAKFFFEVYDAIRRKKNTGATQVKALYTNSSDMALQYEGILIKKYDPPNNNVDLLKS